MSDLLARARILRQHRRHEEAVEMVYQHLAQDPDDPDGHLELAIIHYEVEGMLPTALENARRAAGLRPNDYFPLALQGRILCKMGRPAEALPLAEAAIGINPSSVYSWNCKTMALADTQQLARAEESARHACALDPDNADATNLLAHVLRVRGQLDESLAESRRMLARDPDNPIAFTNSGWTAIQQREVKEAERYFKEALRLDPNSERAKKGLKEAYRMRSAPYRLLSRDGPWLPGLRYGLTLLLGIGLPLTGKVSPIQAVMLALGGFYLIVSYGTIVAPVIAHFVILLDPVARLSLESWEKVEGLVVAGLFFVGLGLLASGLLFWKSGLLLAACVWFASALPFARGFSRTSLWGLGIYFACGFLILCFGMMSAVKLLSTPADQDPPPAVGAGLFACLMLTILVVWRCKVSPLPRRN